MLRKIHRQGYFLLGVILLLHHMSRSDWASSLTRVLVWGSRVRYSHHHSNGKGQRCILRIFNYSTNNKKEKTRVSKEFISTKSMQQQLIKEDIKSIEWRRKGLSHLCTQLFIPYAGCNFVELLEVFLQLLNVFFSLLYVFTS